MSIYEKTNQQIKELQIEAHRIYECQQKIGEFFFDLYHNGGVFFELYPNGGLHDANLKRKIAELIDEVKPNRNLLLVGGI